MMPGTVPLEQQIADLVRLLKALTAVLVVVAFVALVFTASNVTLFAIDHEVSPWIAWLLDPMVACALGAVLVFDGRLSGYGIYPSGWASALRWFAGLGTWVMNCWTSLWPAGTGFGLPARVDPAGLVLHSIPPVLQIILAEAITHYRRAILAKITELRALVDADGHAVDTPAVHPASPRPSTLPAPAGPASPAHGPVGRASLVICGDRAVHPLTVPPAAEEAAEEQKLSAREALAVIRACWGAGATIAEAARKSTRSTSYVHKVYQRLAKDEQTPQLALVGGGES